MKKKIKKKIKLNNKNKMLMRHNKNKFLKKYLLTMQHFQNKNNQNKNNFMKNQNNN